MTSNASKNGENVPAPRALTASEQKELTALHRHSAAEIAAMARPGEGFERVAPEALAALARHADLARILQLDPAELQAGYEAGRHLADLESVAYDLYRRAYENRMQHESEVYRALLKANRVAHAMGEADVLADFAMLDQWISSTHPGHAGPPAPAPAGTATAAATPPGRAPAPAASATAPAAS